MNANIFPVTSFLALRVGNRFVKASGVIKRMKLLIETSGMFEGLITTSTYTVILFEIAK